MVSRKLERFGCLVGTKNFHPWQKLLIVFACIFGALNLTPLWLPTLVVGGTAYGIYRLVRAVALGSEIPRSAIVAAVMFVGIGALYLDHSQFFGGSAPDFR